MAGATVKKEYKINIKKLVYALLTTDTATGCTYGTVKPFASVRQVQLSPTIASGDCYGNGAKEKSITKVTGYDLTVDVNKVPIDVRAEIFGHKITTGGVLVSGASDQPKEIAIGYEIEQTGDTREVVWLLKGTPQPMSENVQQAESNINFSTDSIKINFVKREYDGQYQAIGDTAYSTFTDVMANTFLDTVPATFTFTA